MKNDKPHRIPLTFKNTPEDDELYYWLKRKSSKSGFIKDILFKIMKEEKSTGNK